MSIIYLDQWVYVQLLRTQKHLSPQYPKYEDILRELLDTSSTGANIFPFSLAHLEETHRRTKLSSRKELFKLIFELSRFCTIRPWNQAIEPEVRNAILQRLGFQPADLSGFVFGDELGHCFGSKADIKSKVPGKEVPQEEKLKILSALKDPELVAEALSKDPDLDFIEQMVKRDEELAAELEKLRKTEYSHPDKNMRKNISEARFLIDIIEPRFTKILFALKSELKPDLNPREFAGKVFASKESAEAFARSVPTAYVHHVLNDARGRNTSRPIEAHDYWDLSSLAIAVPYCDVVVTEREWSNILNEKRIGELYSTRITHKIGLS